MSRGHRRITSFAGNQNTKYAFCSSAGLQGLTKCRNVIATVAQIGAGGMMGSENSADLTQDGSFNLVSLVDQNGFDNSAVVTQSGDSNEVALIDQDGSANSATLNFTGNLNGTAAFTGASDAANVGLTQGQVIQNNASGSSLNTISYDVFGDSNLFAFEQNGSGNTIDGDVGSMASDAFSNEAAVAQNGDGNTASFTQMGTGNNLGITQ